MTMMMKFYFHLFFFANFIMTLQMHRAPSMTSPPPLSNLASIEHARTLTNQWLLPSNGRRKAGKPWKMAYTPSTTTSTCTMGGLHIKVVMAWTVDWIGVKTTCRGSQRCVGGGKRWVGGVQTTCGG
jgi:hypothetical protein